MKKTVLLVCAMKSELDGFKAALKNKSIKFLNNKNEYKFKIKNYDCIASYIGITFFNIGKLTKLISKYNPNFIISFGTQAGLKNQKIGTVIVSNNVVCSDINMKNFGYLDGTIDKKKNKSYGPLMCSGSHFMSSKKEKNNLKKRFKGVATFDMETYMIYCICKEYKIPYLSMKAISDNGEENPNKSFEQNLFDVSYKSSNFVLENLNKYIK